ncbi:MAG: carbohydrate-binding domain-containing protein [Clostridia bacterium]|nr:carbohydrate-binding domain-containing protein [Clostridia bacterium]
MFAMKKKLTMFLVFAMLLSSCGTETVPDDEETAENTRVIVDSTGNTVVTGESSENDADTVPVVDLSEFDLQTEDEDAAEIKLNGTSADCDHDGVTVEDGRIMITSAGSYRLTGDYTGQILVQAGADDNVHLILSGVIITGEMAPVYVSNCKNASITLADGTVNSVSDGQNYTFAEGEDEPDAAIFSDCDLTINGAGTLNVTGNYACGIRTKDDLRIVGGNINVTSVGDAVKGRDSLQIAGGNFNITSEADGLKSNNDEDADRGYIVIDGGNFTISAGDDGVHAESRLIVNGGNLTVTSSYEGLEAMKVELNGGNLDITASDDALNAASPSTGDNEADDWFGRWQDQRQNGGKGGGSLEETEPIPSGTTLSAEKTLITLAETEETAPRMPGSMGGFGGMMGGFGGAGMPGGMTPPDGMPEDMTPPDGMPGGMTPPDDMPEGMNPPDGMGEIPASPDGNTGFDWNNRGGRGDKGGNMGGFGGMNGGGFGGETPEEGVWIKITGGNIRLCGGVDVLDSNGTIEITGGNVIVDTPRLSVYGSPDGIFDANGEVSLAGGTYAAFARSTGSVTQILKNPALTLSGQIAAGTAVEVKDSSDSVIFSGNTRNGSSAFFLTSDRLKSGEAYTVTAGDSVQTVTAQ